MSERPSRLAQYIVLWVAAIGCSAVMILGIVGVIPVYPTIAAFAGRIGISSSSEGNSVQSEHQSAKGVETAPAKNSEEQEYREPRAPGEKPMKRAFNAVGVYLTAKRAGDDAFLQETMDALQTASGSAIVFDVKETKVFFETTSPMAKRLKLVVPLADLRHVVDTAHKRGIYTIARFVALKDAELSLKQNESHIRHPQTLESVGVGWVDGSRPITLQYNHEILRDLAASGVDEINLDYIRYPTEYPTSAIGLSGKEKAAHITKFLKMARSTIDTYGSGTILGISTYAILGWDFPINFEQIGQDIPEFAKIVDIVSPMAYPSTFVGAYYTPGVDKGSRMYHLVNRTMEGYKELVGPENAHKIRPWIQGYYADPQEIADQIQAVYDAGSCGYTVWSAGNVYTEFYAAQPMVKRPAKCD